MGISVMPVTADVSAETSLVRSLGANSVTSASLVDGIHLDADQHDRVGKAFAAFIATLPVLQ